MGYRAVPEAGVVVDHFAPKIVVGNTTNGDPATAQAFPFRYIPDLGDGSGVALALTEIAVAGQGGDVYLRPGVYDFGLAGSPALPLTIPDDVKLHGVAFASLTDPTRGSTLVVSQTSRHLSLSWGTWLHFKTWPLSFHHLR